jgi:hypothetical protein
MNRPTLLATATLPVSSSDYLSLLQRRVFLIALLFGCLLFSPVARSVTPPPDGGYASANTAEGTDALFHLAGGFDNTAIGFNALFSNTAGSSNTAVGSFALQSNTTGIDNTANGTFALLENTTGDANTANGIAALQSNTTGSSNTANGTVALANNTSGSDNTANGTNALERNTIGNNNTANGDGALFSNKKGNDNTAEGFEALQSNTGSFNIALGSNAGANQTTGSHNIDIGNTGVAGESRTIRIGTRGLQNATFVAGIDSVAVSGSPVVVNQAGQLGIATSSARFKEAIKPMDKASEAILALKAVRFRYVEEIDPYKMPQFGLIAEDVEKVNSDLVGRDENGNVTTVRYEAVNAMLLNEFQKEHRRVHELEANLMQQQKHIEALEADIRRLDAKH